MFRNIKTAGLPLNCRKRIAKVLSIVTLALFAFGLACFPPAKADLSTPKGESWAIIVGVSVYSYATDLTYCDDDAISLYNQIAPTWGENHVKLLTDTQANKTDIHDAIFNWLAPAEDENDTVLFFFSGHGDYGPDVPPYDESDNIDEYLCPSDTKSGHVNEIRDDEFDAWLDILNSKRIAVILDTCYSGGFISKAVSEGGAVSRALPTHVNPELRNLDDCFAKDISKSGRVILAAAAENETSMEYSALRHGVFSYYIIDSLSKLEIVDTNLSREISAEEIFNYAAPLTVSYTQNHTDLQHPQLYDGFDGELSLITTVTITFDSSPRAASFTVDGTTYSRLQLPRPFLWATNTTHTFNASSQAYEINVESPHPYPTYYNNTWNITRSNATQMRVHFSYILTERNYDRVYILDNAGNICANYTGNYDSMWSLWVPGDTIKIRLTSDYSICYDGFIVDGLEYTDNIGHTNREYARYTFSSWNDGNTSSLRTMTFTESQTLNATYNTEYYLTVNSPYGSRGGEGWYPNGTTTYATLDIGMVDHLNGTRRAFINWTEDGTGSNFMASNPIYMNASKTATANWKTQYNLTISSAHGNTTGAGWYDAGETANAVLSSGTVPGESGIQYVFTNWSGGASGTGLTSNNITMNSPKTVTANWKTQYYLTVSSAHGTTGGAGWYDSGASASATITTPTVAGGAGTQYIFTSWSGGASGTSSTSNPIIMNSPKTATANWRTQYYLTVSSAHGTTGGAGWYDSGATTNAVLSSGTVSGGAEVQYLFTGWGGDASGTGSTSSSIEMSSAKTATANWRTQYYLTVSSAYGATGGAGWYDPGASTSATVTPLAVTEGTGIRHLFTGWSGGAAGTTSPSGTIVMDGPKTATANWKTQCYLTVSTTHGTAGGEGWYDAGSSASATVSPLILRTEGIQYVFTGWGGDAAGATSPSDAITMNSPRTASAEWKTEYYLDLSTDFGSVAPGSGWHDAGSTVTVSVAEPSAGSGEHYVWNGWSGTGGNSYSGLDNTITVTMNGPVAEVASWTHQYLLTVTSAFGSPTPNGDWYNAGTTISASVNSPLPETFLTQHVCIGWTGTGSVAATGKAASVSFTLDKPSSITWKWQTEIILPTLLAVIAVPAGAAAGVVTYLLWRRHHKRMARYPPIPPLPFPVQST